MEIDKKVFDPHRCPVCGWYSDSPLEVGDHLWREHDKRPHESFDLTMTLAGLLLRRIKRRRQEAK